MIIEGVRRGYQRARGSVTLDNIALSQEHVAGMQRSLPLVGGKFATYEALYRTQPWAYANVNRLVRGLARLPLPIYTAGGRPDERVRVRDGSLYDLVRRPWTVRTGGVVQAGNTPLLIQAVLLPSLIYGFNIMVKGYFDDDGRRRNEPVSLMPSNPWGWMPIWEGNRLTMWHYRSPGGDVAFLPDEVWIFAPWGFGRGGMPSSPFEALRTTLMTEDATQRAVIQRFEKGARPVGFISFDAEVKPESLRARREMLEQVYGGVDNFYKVMLLDHGAKFNEMGSSFVDTELINLRKLNREEVAAVFNMPQPSVGILDRATFSNVTEQHLMEYMDTYGPPATLFEESFATQVIDPEPAWNGLYIEFNFKEILRGDPTRELETLVKAAGRPVLTLNEARATQNLRPFREDEDPNADRVLEPVNMTTGAGSAT